MASKKNKKPNPPKTNKYQGKIGNLKPAVKVKKKKGK
jgi:hypothetical protein